MDLSRLRKLSETAWELPPQGPMRVPAVFYGTRSLLEEMDEKVAEQAANVASLPGIVRAAYALPDAHWGYGFPIGGVAAFDPEQGGVVSAGGVGFDISCGVRTLLTGLPRESIAGREEELAGALAREIPAGVGARGKVRLDDSQMDAMLLGGARWAVESGFGEAEDLDRIEERGCMDGADPSAVSREAKRRQKDEMGTLGSGNHYAEVQEVSEIYRADIARAYGLERGELVISIHCGSRGLGHQIGTDFLREMAAAADSFGLRLPEKELASAPLSSELGRRYLGAMRAGINCALANRQILTHLIRKVFARFFPGHRLALLYDVSHNTCKEEIHSVDGRPVRLFVHRKGATRALGPGHPDLPSAFSPWGQPVLIGGSMGTCSYILAGDPHSEEKTFSSAVHGAGRQMSRNQAARTWDGKDLVEELERRGVLVRARSHRGVAEEAPGAYKDVSAVVDAAEAAGLARRVARLNPLICVKG
ncbi:tRNA-splicing ligase RtcB [Methylacidimicrobium sp. AP8]|uniref:RtcB family protein n=1 Tax=Methylacidimicrobium sp. AP8 TaxID=2730359 RepID=UPI0018C19C39|nr:RtcB family protein [Methylacidimicrobium sp. AP8]CAB4242611.1 tRNA-splicing ligase RtcB [Methylacidimicrobium sp. AP8]